MTISYKVKITKYILGSLLPNNRSFELQVKQPKKLGHLYPFEFTVMLRDIGSSLQKSPFLINTDREAIKPYLQGVQRFLKKVTYLEGGNRLYGFMLDE